MPFARTEARRGGFGFRFDGLTVRVDNGTDVLAIPLEWAFGSGHQAVTFVSQGDDRHYLEHYLTYYTALRTFGPTPGQRELRPVSLAEAAGLLYKKKDPVAGIDGCFACHTTADRAEHGVRCEACHGPGAGHAANPVRIRLGAPREKQIEFCGRCHRPPASDPAKIDWNYAWNVRHQPVYLSQSACFRQGKVTCTTCHDPHAKLAATGYDAKCAACHAKTAPGCGPRDCAGCHMPRVSPEPPLRFTNHWIGVYRGGANLKPATRR